MATRQRSNSRLNPGESSVCDMRKLKVEASERATLLRRDALTKCLSSAHYLVSASTRRGFGFSYTMDDDEAFLYGDSSDEETPVAQPGELRSLLVYSRADAFRRALLQRRLLKTAPRTSSLLFVALMGLR